MVHTQYNFFRRFQFRWATPICYTYKQLPFLGTEPLLHKILMMHSTPLIIILLYTYSVTIWWFFLDTNRLSVDRFVSYFYWLYVQQCDVRMLTLNDCYLWEIFLFMCIQQLIKKFQIFVNTATVLEVNIFQFCFSFRRTSTSN